MPATLRACLDASSTDADQPGTIEPAPTGHAGMQVTLVLRHRVTPHVVPDYELWLARIDSAAQDAAGFLGAHVIRPLADGGDYKFVPRFDNAAHLARWRASPDFVALLAEVDRLLETSPARVSPSGVPAWFGLPRLFARRRPA